MPIRPDNETAMTIAREIIASIRQIIDAHGERPPGSAGERACQEQLRDEMRAAGITASIEPFTVSQKAFMAMPLVCSTLTLCALPLYWLAPRLAPFPAFMALLVCVFELLFYRHVLSPFFPKSESVNMAATLPARGKTRQRILLIGHADAAYEWRLLRLFPRIFPLFIITLVLSTVYVLITTTVAALLNGDPTIPGIWRWLGYSQFLALPGLVAGLCYTNFRKVAPGAADNLSGALATTRLLQWMHTENIVFEHTEVTALVTGSEEAGLVGARAYIAAHRHELADIPTVAIAVDTISELAHLKVYVRDLNGRVRHDARVCALIREGGRKCGLELPDGVVTVGASDAAAFSQAGIPAAAICAMDPAPAHYYHNRQDACEVLEEAALSKALELLATVCALYDERGAA